MSNTPSSLSRRDFLRKSAGTMGAASALAALPLSIQRALAVPAAVETGTIKDVKHIVILMQENRAFNHYFGTMKGVRGFGDRFPIPLESGKSVWYQSDGTKEVPPYHLDKETMNAIFVPGTPHSFSDAQAAWNQGKFGEWAKHKLPYSMGYYKRQDLPFQFALAEAFTICDAYHCSITTGTDPNRIVFWSGSNFNPELGRLGINCTDSDSEPNNLRCWITGALPTPGYTYQGSSFKWKTIPDVLEEAGVSWRIYQDPNNNWTGAMHGGLAFQSFRESKPGDPLYEKGMSHFSLERLAEDVRNDTLPEVSWVLPWPAVSEHPSGGGSTAQGADYISQVLDALTANPEVWSKTVFFMTFDENDGLFDHLPPPAVPSYDAEGNLMGKSTVPLDGEYFYDPARKYLKAEDTISGTTRPWGLGPRVPMYVISPWSRGGWVCSEALDHTSVGRFLEKRFDITIDAISPWHRAVCGDLTAAFDFAAPNDPSFPELPDMSNFAELEAQQKAMPKAEPPATPQPLFQETGVRYSRALPYELHTSARIEAGGVVRLLFSNTGTVGAVFHVYDKNHLDLIPRRYTVEAGKMLEDTWATADDGGDYDLWVYSTNGFVRVFQGNAGRHAAAAAKPEVQVCYDAQNGNVYAKVHNGGTAPAQVSIVANAYRSDGPWTLEAPAGGQAEQHWELADSGCWYDFTVKGDDFERRFAGRVETGKHGVSDPAMALHLGA
ncbi:MAG: phospholipase C, phosphocholine-specific [Pigmentiphaga sp.]|uniref:phosphocholine-specific phospholipase C n=1 Tax=Pigmentiphaga sp. TaxID=1977564 RepID=UPI0029AA1208|nr:phospholipase C, phosphocholine-specific [Pigmentiphaga sp.]MDX3905060.1 phospholipase C, phosphocholine-specific [Pigmentiphaga sp.]